MATPQEPIRVGHHAHDYRQDAWREYTPAELGQWVALLLKRSSHRTNAVKRAKDIYDAENYADMLRAHVVAAREQASADALEAE